MPFLSPVPLITGPTGVGKSRVAVLVAERLGAEILSCDSRQAYKWLSIGTSKPSRDDLQRVPHHFIDHLEIEEEYSAGAFAEQAERVLAGLRNNDRAGLVVGGSTLYVHALTDGLSAIPDVPRSVRASVAKTLAEEGPAVVWERLTAADPDWSLHSDPSKTQRNLRALEVLQHTGIPMSVHQQNRMPTPFSYRVVVLTRPRAELYARINRRVDRMLSDGLVAEVEGVLKRGVDPTVNALQSIGYREVVTYLKGQIDASEMERRIKQNTRRYAKRQLTWYRRYPDYRWVVLDENESSELAAERVSDTLVART